ncbi:hypothetical protein CFE70_010682 [Pyrenophora teres f. teres 0-1]
MQATVFPTFAALLASAQALPSPQDEVKVIPPWKLEVLQPNGAVPGLLEIISGRGQTGVGTTVVFHFV